MHNIYYKSRDVEGEYRGLIVDEYVLCNNLEQNVQYRLKEFSGESISIQHSLRLRDMKPT